MEYIERDAAIKKLRGESIANFPMSYSIGIIAASEEIKSIPAADVVPVVRCRECANKFDWPWRGMFPDDGYCSAGARMDGDGA